MDLQSMDRRNPKFQRTLAGGLSHQKSVVARSVVHARGSSSQLESQHQGFANLGVSVRSSRPANQGDAANPFVRARLFAQETKRVSELTPEDASSTFASTPPLESLKFMFSRCMTGDRRAASDVNVLGLYDISRAPVHSPARYTTVFLVQEWVHSSGQRDV